MPKATEDSQVLASLAMVTGDVSSVSVEFLGPEADSVPRPLLAANEPATNRINLVCHVDLVAAEACTKGQKSASAAAVVGDSPMVDGGGILQAAKGG